MISDSKQSLTLDRPILPALINLALPTVLVMFLSSFLSVVEIYYITQLGTDSVAAASMVLPFILLMTMVSNGGVGGGVSQAVARSLGAGNVSEIETLIWHTILIGLFMGLLFTLCMWIAGPMIYEQLGGEGRSLEQAISYSTIIFGGASLSWVLALLQSSLRGIGNTKIPALATTAAVLVGLLISPALISGNLGLPQMGVIGAAVSQIITNFLGLAIVIWFIQSKHSFIKIKPQKIQKKYLLSILRVGIPSSINASLSNLVIIVTTGTVGIYGVEAIAAYGIASRIDALLIPILFGFGTASVTLIAANLGAGKVHRARQISIVNAIFVGIIFEFVGLALVFKPDIWLSWFSINDQVSELSVSYLLLIAPTYGITAITMQFFFAGQGARQITWPLVATIMRLICALITALLAFLHIVHIQTVFILTAVGIILASLISIWGHAKATWR